MTSKQYLVIILFLIVLLSCNNQEYNLSKLSYSDIIDSFEIQSNESSPSFINTYTNIVYPYLVSLSEDGRSMVCINLEKQTTTSINISNFLKSYNINQLNNFCFINYDSIYINGFDSKYIYLIDSTCLLKDSIRFNDNNNKTERVLINSYSNPMHYLNRGLYLAYQNTFYNNYYLDSNHRQAFFSEAIAYKVQLDNNNKITKFAKYPQYFIKKDDYYDWYINSCVRAENIDYVFSNIDSIYSYNTNTNLLTSIPINNQYHSINFKFNHSKAKSYDDIRKYYIENSFYNRIYFDVFRNQYILIYSKGIKYEKNKFENNLYLDKNNIILIKNNLTQKNKYIQLDHSFIIGSLAFNDKGILVAKKVKNKIIYYVYKI